MVRDANLRLLADVPHRVGIGRVKWRRNLDTRNVNIQIVIRENHALVDGCVGTGAVDVAVEKIVSCRAEWGLDVVVVLGNDVRHLGEVGVVVFPWSAEAQSSQERV